jgi:hypothetical protein
LDDDRNAHAELAGELKHAQALRHDVPSKGHIGNLS